MPALGLLPIFQQQRCAKSSTSAAVSLCYDSAFLPQLTSSTGCVPCVQCLHTCTVTCPVVIVLTFFDTSVITYCSPHFSTPGMDPSYVQSLWWVVMTCDPHSQRFASIVLMDGECVANSCHPVATAHGDGMAVPGCNVVYTVLPPTHPHFVF